MGKVVSFYGTWAWSSSSSWRPPSWPSWPPPWSCPWPPPPRISAGPTASEAAPAASAASAHMPRQPTGYRTSSRSPIFQISRKDRWLAVFLEKMAFLGASAFFITIFLFYFFDFYSSKMLGSFVLECKVAGSAQQSFSCTQSIL